MSSLQDSEPFEPRTVMERYLSLADGGFCSVGEDGAFFLLGASRLILSRSFGTGRTNSVFPDLSGFVCNHAIARRYSPVRFLLLEKVWFALVAITIDSASPVALRSPVRRAHVSFCMIQKCLLYFVVAFSILSSVALISRSASNCVRSKNVGVV